MSEWITCNLPWKPKEPEPLLPEPDLSEMERVLFGLSDAEASSKWDPLGDPKDLEELDLLLGKIQAWREGQPEYQRWEHAQEIAAQEWVKTGFCDNLDRPGTLLELEDGTRLLIGHITPGGWEGADFDCLKLRKNPTILRYKLLDLGD